MGMENLGETLPEPWFIGWNFDGCRKAQATTVPTLGDFDKSFQLIFSVVVTVHTDLKQQKSPTQATITVSAHAVSSPYDAGLHLVSVHFITKISPTLQTQDRDNFLLGFEIKFARDLSKSILG